MEICRIFKEDPENVAYIGDGIIDIPVFEIAGCSISVPNGHDAVKKKSLLITEKCGGDGVLYEVVELILKSKNQFSIFVFNLWVGYNLTDPCADTIPLTGFIDFHM